MSEILKCEKVYIKTDEIQYNCHCYSFWLFGEVFSERALKKKYTLTLLLNTVSKGLQEAPNCPPF